MEEEFNKALQIIENNPDISYSGKLHHEINKKLVELLEILVKEKYEKQSFQRRIFHVMVEMLQNIHIHRVINEATTPLVKIKMHIDTCYLLTENMISNHKTEELVRNLKGLNKISSDYDKIKQLYKAKINGDEFPPNFIVEDIRGLGLIEIVRKSKNKILYNLEKIDDQNSRISLITIVDIKKP
jgi:hypothetical protein